MCVCKYTYILGDKMLDSIIIHVHTYTSLTEIVDAFLFPIVCQENTNKAAIADFFSQDSVACTTAFSATAFFTGYAGALGYFSFHALHRLHMAGAVRADRHMCCMYVCMYA